jgi:hypothetical protein
MPDEERPRGRARLRWVINGLRRDDSDGPAGPGAYKGFGFTRKFRLWLFSVLAACGVFLATGELLVHQPRKAYADLFLVAISAYFIVRALRRPPQD